jgi:hypothetical protein
MKGEYKVVGIANDVEQFSLALSCKVLVWGICRLAKIVRDFNKMLVNKVMILSHIVAYLLIIIVNIITTLYNDKHPVSKSHEITSICDQLVYFVCTLIFGLIVNTIVTNIVDANIPDRQSIASSLMNAATWSVRGTIKTEVIFESAGSCIPSPKSSRHSINDIEVEMPEEIPEEKKSFIERGSVAEGILATLFRQSN